MSVARINGHGLIQRIELPLKQGLFWESPYVESAVIDKHPCANTPLVRKSPQSMNVRSEIMNLQYQGSTVYLR